MPTDKGLSCWLPDIRCWLLGEHRWAMPTLRILERNKNIVGWALPTDKRAMPTD
jgi:hypothetical protein